MGRGQGRNEGSRGTGRGAITTNQDNFKIKAVLKESMKLTGQLTLEGMLACQAARFRGRLGQTLLRTMARADLQGERAREGPIVHGSKASPLQGGKGLLPCVRHFKHCSIWIEVRDSAREVLKLAKKTPSQFLHRVDPANTDFDHEDQPNGRIIWSVDFISGL